MSAGKIRTTIGSLRIRSAASFAIEMLEDRKLLSAGSPDTTFGAGGTAFSELFPDGSASATALQSDGKIIAAGRGISSSNTQELAIARFNSNGLLDRTYGTGGRVLTNLGTPNESIEAAAIQSDGKLVVAAESENASQTASSIVVLRYLSTGALDTTFGTKGIATISFLGLDTPSSMSIQPNGSIIVAGSAETVGFGTPKEFALARLTSAGKLDNTFGTGGKVMTAFPATGGGVNSLILQPNGDLVASGSTDTGENFFNVTLARYLANGTLDSTFGLKGIVNYPGIPVNGPGGAFEADASAEPVVATLQSNGKIDVATTGNVIPASYSASNTLYVARFNTSGAIDTTFGKSGLASYTSNSFIQPTADFVQKNGDIVVAASADTSTPVNGVSQFLFVRFSTAGVRGTVNYTPMAGSDGNGIDNLNAALQQPNQDIVMVGYSDIGTAGGDFALARYNLAGSLDSSFGYHGTVQQANGITGLINAIAVQSDGKVLIAGSEQSPDPASSQPTDAAIARYNANGTLDTTFGVDGRVYLRIGNSAAWNSIKVQSNGDIVVGGSGQVGAFTEFAVVRYLPSGLADQSFGAGGEVFTSFASKANQVCNSIAIQSNGDIVAAGYLNFQNLNRFAVARYLPNGALDKSFASTGMVTTTFSNPAVVSSVTILKNNDVLLAGTVGNDFELHALLANGSNDNSFGNPLSGGLTAFADGPAVLSAMAIDPTTGNIVVGGTVTNPNTGQSVFALARFTQAGRTDASFGTAGEMTLSLDGEETLNSLTVQSDGKIVVGGTTLGADSLQDSAGIRPFLLGPPTVYATVVRFNSNGSLDKTFGDEGYAFLDQGANFNPTDCIVALQSDGKILAGDIDLHRLNGK